MQMMRIWKLNIPSSETSLKRKKTRLDLKLYNDAAAIIRSDIGRDYKIHYIIIIVCTSFTD